MVGWGFSQCTTCGPVLAKNGYLPFAKLSTKAAQTPASVRSSSTTMSNVSRKPELVLAALGAEAHGNGVFAFFGLDHADVVQAVAEEQDVVSFFFEMRAHGVVGVPFVFVDGMDDRPANWHTPFSSNVSSLEAIATFGLERIMGLSTDSMDCVIPAESTSTGIESP